MNEKPISTLQQIYSDTLGDSVYTTEEVNGKTSVVEYQVRRFVRDDLNKQTIQDNVAQLEDTKSKLIQLGDQLPVVEPTKDQLPQEEPVQPAEQAPAAEHDAFSMPANNAESGSETQAPEMPLNN